MLLFKVMSSLDGRILVVNLIVGIIDDRWRVQSIVVVLLVLFVLCTTNKEDISIHLASKLIIIIVIVAVFRPENSEPRQLTRIEDTALAFDFIIGESAHHNLVHLPVTGRNVALDHRQLVRLGLGFIK